MKKFSSLASMTAAIALLAGSGCTKSRDGGDTARSNANVILLGEIGSMTGAEASFGVSTDAGVKLAVQQINDSGGVKGKKLAVMLLDDQGKPDEAATAVTKLITEDRVAAILGEVASSRSLAMAPIAQRYKVPMITPTSTNPQVTQYGDYIFRACFIDPFQGTVMAKFALDSLKIKKVAVLRDIKNDYSVGLANFFIDTFKKGGGQILIDQSYSAGDVDFKSQLTAIRATNPEAIYVPGYYTDVGLIAREARELGITVPLMGGDGWDSPKLKEIGGKALDGSYISNHYSTNDRNPATQEFVKKFQETYHSLPDSMAALGYDATRMLADAMNRAKTLAASDIRDALATTRDFKGAAGKITMDKDRNPSKSAVVLKLVNGGNFQYVTTVNP